MAGQVQSERRRPHQRRGVAAAAAMLMAAGASTGVAAAQTPEVPPSAPGAQATSVILEADKILREDGDNRIIAEGDVEARHEGRTLRAARIVYDRANRTVRAQGGVVIIDADGTVQTAEEMEVAEDLSTGVAVRYGARFAPNGAIAADAVRRAADGSTVLERMVYTACRVCAADDPNAVPPTWTLRARRALQNPDTKMITYRDAVLNVRGAPVVYLPYFAHPDPSAGARSGFLTPDLGRTNRVGVFYEQPYYWRLGESHDATITALVHEQINPLLKVGYNRRFFSGRASFAGSVTSEQDFDSNGETFGEESLRSHLYGEGRFRITDYWNWGFGIERASDDLYLSRYGISGQGAVRGPIVGDLPRLVSQAYLQGQDANSFVSVLSASVQGLRLADEDQTLPLILPLAFAERVVRDPLFDGQLRINASSVNLARSGAAQDVSRLSSGASWGLTRAVGPGLLVTPFAEGRADYYLVRSGEEDDDSIGRAVGLAGVEVRWPLINATRGATFVVEPVAMAALGSNGGNDPRIPNEDSIAFEVDEATVFRPNAAPGYDLWEPGPRAALGVRASAEFRNAGASVTLGQRWRSIADDAFDESTNLDGTASDYVGAVEGRYGPVRADVRFRLDEQDLSTVRLDGGGSVRAGPLYVGARYLQADQGLRGGEPREEGTVAMSLRLPYRFSFSADLQRNLATDTNLRQTVSLVYGDECTYLAITYSRQETFDSRLGLDEGIAIKFGLSSLGAIND